MRPPAPGLPRRQPTRACAASAEPRTVRTMRRPDVRCVHSCLLALAACAAGPALPPQLGRLLAEAPADATPRLVLAGDRLVGAAVPLGPHSLPPPVRTMVDAVAPGGETTFVGREWGVRGDGYRVEKHYRDTAPPHTRSVLVAGDGAVLERWHTVPLPEVPQPVLATALRSGPTITEARIVSGREREEHWLLVVRDRTGQAFLVRIGLDGALLGRHRRLAGAVDV